ncbi:hypothetical protein K505DRAFT_242148, partial [Melanomma pulvis-pyrius CBS 109.77]
EGLLSQDTIPDAFFDVRTDSDAQDSYFGIGPAGGWDIWLVELAARMYSKRLLKGLSWCIEGGFEKGAVECRAGELQK